jgi:hypothetical protein
MTPPGAGTAFWAYLDMLFEALMAHIAGRLTAGAITAWPIILHMYRTTVANWFFWLNDEAR